jgi:hypothetical protein
VRRTKIAASALTPARIGWKSAALVFTHVAEGKEVHILIEDPWDLTYLREQLTKIANHWKDSVKDL